MERRREGKVRGSRGFTFLALLWAGGTLAGLASVPTTDSFFFCGLHGFFGSLLLTADCSLVVLRHFPTDYLKLPVVHLHLGLYHTSWTKSLLDDWGLTKVTSSQFRGKTHTLNLLIEKVPAMKPCSQLPLFTLPTCRLLNSSGLGQTPVFCITQASRNINQVFWFVLLVSLGEQGDPRLWGLDSARPKGVTEDSWLSWEGIQDRHTAQWMSITSGKVYSSKKYTLKIW